MPYASHLVVPEIQINKIGEVDRKKSNADWRDVVPILVYPISTENYFFDAKIYRGDSWSV